MIALVVIVGVLALTAANFTDSNLHSNKSYLNEVGVHNYSNRTARILWWLGIGVGVVRFENAACPAANGLVGVCYTRRQCSTVNGYASGKCARNIGVCCVVQVTCGAISSHNNTYFSNVNFPNSFVGPGTCSLTIQRCNPGVCQVRLDFLSLVLSQPNGDGICTNDSLIIEGAAAQVPRICGQNSGQHMYLNFNGANDIRLTIFTSTALNIARQWNIRVTQIPCDSASRAPSGCLMYYTALSDTVRSFNYGQDVNPASPSGIVPGTNIFGTRQIANTNYGICVEMQPGYCSIQWSQASGDQVSFTVTGDASMANIPMMGDLCTTDFVVIPNGRYSPDLTVATADRYCGGAFPPSVTTSSAPFVLTTVTDGGEQMGTFDIANRGFSLTYNQQLCGNP